MNIVFRVDSSAQMGTGHLMRCLTLADELQKQNHKITFICRELKGNLIDLIKHNALVLPMINDFQVDDLYLNWLGTTQEQDAQQTIQAMSENTDYLIVDSYALDITWHRQLRGCAKKIMVIDDLANRQFDCDILLNQNLGSKKEDYQNKIPQSCKLLLGCNYALLRPEFSKLRKQALEKRKKTKKIKNIFISMGGSDNKNIAYEALQQLDDKFNVVVVLGDSSPHNAMIKSYTKDKNIEVIINANNMAELMLNADLAIGAGGATTWERCCLGLPSLVFVTAKNQEKTSIYLDNIGAICIVKSMLEVQEKIIELQQKGCIAIEPMIQISSSICDGAGSEKVVAEIVDF